MNLELTEQVRNEVQGIIEKFIQSPQHFGLVPEELEDVQISAHANALQDLSKYAESDPAAAANKHYVFESYLSFKAVLYYRVANSLFNLRGDDSDSVDDGIPSFDPLLRAAREISEAAKVGTGIEIHPAAKIGTPFVIDHGWNTVIGETAKIGDECYFLQNVLLGARSVSDGTDGPRHPQIGDRVQIAGGAQIIGNIDIGNDVFIEPGAKITWNVPNNTNVSVACAYQVCNEKRVDRQGNRGTVIYGLVPEGDNQFALYGKNLDGMKPYFCWNNSLSHTEYTPNGACPACFIDMNSDIDIIENNSQFVRFKVTQVHTIEPGAVPKTPPSKSHPHGRPLPIAFAVGRNGLDDIETIFLVNALALREIDLEA